LRFEALDLIRPAPVVRQMIERHRRAAAREGFGGGEPDAGRGAGHERGFPREIGTDHGNRLRSNRRYRGDSITRLLPLSRRRRFVVIVPRPPKGAKNDTAVTAAVAPPPYRLRGPRPRSQPPFLRGPPRDSSGRHLVREELQHRDAA